MRSLRLTDVTQKSARKWLWNHGTYTVSIQVDEHGLGSACSCYIGKHGHCHHCEALARTFLENPSAFNPTATLRVDTIKRPRYAPPTYLAYHQEAAYVTSLSDRWRRIYHSHV